MDGFQFHFVTSRLEVFDGLSTMGTLPPSSAEEGNEFIRGGYNCC